MSVKSMMREKSFKSSILTKEIFIFLLLVLIVFFIGEGGVFATGTNHLLSLKEDAAATFGSSSDLPNYLYGAEGLTALVTYIKTKSPMVFLGLPIVMIFTTFALTKAFGTAGV